MVDFLVSPGAYLLLIALLISTGMGMPIPEEVPIVAAGIASSYGYLHWGLAFASCLIGAILGDCVMYWIGYYFGHSIVREHRWWTSYVTAEREAQIEQMLQRHGLKVLLLARFLVGLRSPVYLSVGILRMPFRRFLMIDLFCATMVIGTFFGLSYRYGQTVTDWIRDAEITLSIIVVVALTITACFFWRRHRRKVASSPTSSENSLTKEKEDTHENAGETKKRSKEERVA